MILLIDNYDSFTYNLYHLMAIYTNLEIVVKRNDAITINDIEQMKPRLIVISPGPSSPLEAGICINVVKKFVGIIPLFGICLGHQVIGQVSGAKVVKAHTPYHGKISLISKINNSILLDKIPQNFNVTRYHSLIVKGNLGYNLIATSYKKTEDSDVEIMMSMEDLTNKIFSVQFHPESIATEYGDIIIKNLFSFLQIAQI